MTTPVNSRSTNRGQTSMKWLSLLLAVGVTLVGGVLYGSYSQRWGPAPDMVAAGARVAELPKQLGSWKLAEELPTSQTELNMLESTGYVNRKYINQESGNTIHVAILVGPSGPTAVHTPEICFSSRAYDAQTDRKEVEIIPALGRAHSFWSLDFSTRNPFADRLRVYYAWSLGETWKASASPRYEFAAAPMLYKIQLSSTISPALDEGETDPGQEFLEALLASEWDMAVTEED